MDYLSSLETLAAPFKLRVEHPVDAGSREDQITMMVTLRKKIKDRGLTVEIVADEWCNTLSDIEQFIAAEAVDVIQIKMPDLGSVDNSIAAVTMRKAAGVKAYLGGSCAETEVSAKISAQIAIATQPYQVLAKPGMGVDEAVMLVRNEMKRTLALIQQRRLETASGSYE